MPAWRGHDILPERRWTWLCECGSHGHAGTHEERDWLVFQHVQGHEARPLVRFRCQTQVPCLDCKSERQTLTGWL